MDTQEQWRPVCSGWYEVSDQGNVRRVRPSKSYPKGRLGLPLKQSPDNGGYLQVGISIDGRCTTTKVHWLVAEAFLGPRPVGLTINHIDGNKSNNRASNLEYVTYRENCRHSHSLGLSPVGVRCGSAKLNEDDVRTIKCELSKGAFKMRLAKRFGVSPSVIRAINNGTTWRSVK